MECDNIILPAWVRGELHQWVSIGSVDGRYASNVKVGSERYPLSQIHVDVPQDSRTLVPEKVYDAVIEFADALRRRAASRLECDHVSCDIADSAVDVAVEWIDRPGPRSLTASLALGAAAARTALEQATLVVALNHHGALRHAPDGSWGADHYFASQQRFASDRGRCVEDLRAADLPTTVNEEGEEIPPVSVREMGKQVPLHSSRARGAPIQPPVMRAALSSSVHGVALAPGYVGSCAA